MAPFGPIFPLLRAKKFFQENQALSQTTLQEILAPCQILEKLMTQFQENAQTDRMEGRKDRRTDRRMNRRTEGRTEGWRDPIL